MKWETSTTERLIPTMYPYEKESYSSPVSSRYQPYHRDREGRDASDRERRDRQSADGRHAVRDYHGRSERDRDRIGRAHGYYDRPLRDKGDSRSPRETGEIRENRERERDLKETRDHRNWDTKELRDSRYPIPTPPASYQRERRRSSGWSGPDQDSWSGGAAAPSVFYDSPRKPPADYRAHNKDDSFASSEYRSSPYARRPRAPYPPRAYPQHEHVPREYPTRDCLPTRVPPPRSPSYRSPHPSVTTQSPALAPAGRPRTRTRTFSFSQLPDTLKFVYTENSNPEIIRWSEERKRLRAEEDRLQTEDRKIKFELFLASWEVEKHESLYAQIEHQMEELDKGLGPQRKV
ncbi:hypothetical protein BC832DRAFT_553876 [Gaertneriomyces semiglobifer]|nr:hypothetical protein BC832DRAFT_553876 [Gaertneriomyces semiglobifer]